MARVSPPCTPSRYFASSSHSKAGISPFFPRKWNRSPSPSESAACRRPAARSGHSVVPKRQEQESHDLFNNSLHFLHLCRQLSLMKPVLIQERLGKDPWKLLIAVTLLNKTAGKLAIPVFWEIVARYPTPVALSQATLTDLKSFIQPLGLQSIRAKRLINLSTAYLNDPPAAAVSRQSNAYTICIPPSQVLFPIEYPASPSKRKRYPPTPISHLPGAGPYALDSYRIFCSEKMGDWKDVMPTDKELIRYLKWKWAFDERKKWLPGVGVVGIIDVHDIEELISQLKPSAPMDERMRTGG